MQVNAGKLQILTVAAMLVLISGGIAVYAQNQFAIPNSGAPGAADQNTSSSDSSSSSMFTSSDTSTTFSTSTSSTSTITSSSSTSTTPHTLCQPPSTGHEGKLVLPITATGPTAASTGAIAFSDGRGCYAAITTEGGVFNVQILLRYAKPLTQYNVALVANGTSYTLGNMVTGPGGNGQMDNQVLLKTGTYIVSIQIFDTSSNPGQSTLVLQTGQGTIISLPFPTSASGGHDGQQGGQGGTGQDGQGGGQGNDDGDK